MKLITYTNPKMIIADEGKKIRAKDDTWYIEDETGVEHSPKYSTVIFVPKSFTEAQMNAFYIEEDIY